MQIIIVGCGKVGYTLVDQLNCEEHNIIAIDTDETNLKKVTNDLDVMGCLGNGVSYKTLLEAGLDHTDLLIAVTGSDEQNLLCCAIAKKAGDCKTIARVRNPIYNNELDFLKKQFGLSMIINPELASASEIARVFRFPSAIKVDTFAKGRIELFHIRIPAGSILIDAQITDIRNKLKCDVLVCVVLRDNQTIIPNGDFIFAQNDIISIVATPTKANSFFQKIGIDTNHVKNAILVGGGKISYYLAKRLLTSGISVKIIELDKDRCEELSELLPDASIINGDGTDQNLLFEEGIEKALGFAALTDVDEENIVLSLFAKNISQAKTITKINRINFIDVVNQLNLDSILYPRLITADCIIQYVRSMYKSIGSNVENLYKLNSSAEALEFAIKEESPVTNIPFETLRIKKNILICCIMRNGNIIIPGGQDSIQVDDTVIIVLNNYRIHDITDILEA